MGLVPQSPSSLSITARTNWAAIMSKQQQIGESIKLRALQFSFSISPRCYKALISTHISYSALNFSHPMTTHRHPATRCHFPSLSSLTHRPLWCGERKEKPTPSIHFIITNGLHSPVPAATSLFHTECMHACTWPLLCLSCRNTCLSVCVCVDR